MLSRVHNLQLDNKGTGSEFGPSPCIRENMKSKGSAGEYHEGIYVGINRIWIGLYNYSSFFHKLCAYRVYGQDKGSIQRSVRQI